MSLYVDTKEEGSTNHMFSYVSRMFSAKNLSEFVAQSGLPKWLSKTKTVFVLANKFPYRKEEK